MVKKQKHEQKISQVRSGPFDGFKLNFAQLNYNMDFRLHMLTQMLPGLAERRAYQRVQDVV